MFKIKVTPRFGETDALRHINNNVLGDWFELGRNELFKIFTPDLQLSDETWKLIMVRMEIDYLGQIFFGEDVDIRTYITHIGNTSFTIGHEAWQNGELKSKGKNVVVHYNFIEQTKTPIPKDIKEKLEEHLVKEEDIGKK
jgi:acyl-CoA thioester hydrolase